MSADYSDLLFGQLVETVDDKVNETALVTAGTSRFAGKIGISQAVYHTKRKHRSFFSDF